MSPFEIASIVASVALSATRLLQSAAPLWAKLPKPVAVLLPVLVLALPKIAELAGAVHTSVDLANYAVLAAALLVPGLASAESPTTPTA